MLRQYQAKPLTLHSDMSVSVGVRVDKVSGLQLHVSVAIKGRNAFKGRECLIAWYFGGGFSIVHPVIVLRLVYILCALGRYDMFTELRMLQQV